MNKPFSLPIPSLILLFVFMLLAAGCYATGPTAFSKNDSDVGGTWTGESICQIKNSPCHDEKVIYRITNPDEAGKLTIDADKVVNGSPDFMGTLNCIYRKDDHIIGCDMGNGFWEFMVSGNTIAGTLTLPDKTLYRKVSLKKETKN